MHEEGFESLARHVDRLETGSRPPGGVSKYSSGVPSISAEQFDKSGSFITDTLSYVPEEFFRSARNGIIEKGDILVVKDGATTGKCAYVDLDFPFPKAMINEHTYILRTRPSLFSKYAYYYLRSRRSMEYFEKKRMHGVIGGLKKSFIKEIKIPVPKIEIQRKVVAQIENLTSRIKEVAVLRRKVLNDLSLFSASIIEKVIYKNSKNLLPLENFILEGPRNGWSPPLDANGDIGTPILTLSAVTGFRYNGTKIRLTSARTSDRAYYWLREGELLISRSNTLDLVGHSAIYSGIPTPCICPDLIMKMTINPKKASTKYIHYCLQSNPVRQYITLKARGTSGTMKKINKKHVLGIPVPEFSLSEQKDIVRYLDSLLTTVYDLDDAYHDIYEEITDLEISFLNKALV